MGNGAGVVSREFLEGRTVVLQHLDDVFNAEECVADSEDAEVWERSGT